VCQEAALGPIRELGAAALRTVRAEDVRPLNEEVPDEFCYVEWLGIIFGFSFSYICLALRHTATAFSRVSPGFPQCRAKHSAQCVQRQLGDLQEVGGSVWRSSVTAHGGFLVYRGSE
jgi:hypothetical protein